MSEFPTWTDDGVTLDILAPSLPVLADTGDDINENGIVVIPHRHYELVEGQLQWLPFLGVRTLTSGEIGGQPRHRAAS